MKRFFLLLLLPVNICVAQRLPSFNPAPVEVAVPAYLPGVLPDSAARMHNDTLYYTMQGMLFGKKKAVLPATAGHTTMHTPFETLSALVTAYTKRDRQGIAALYDTLSAEKVRAYITSRSGDDYLSYVKATVMGAIELVALLQYKDGFIAFVKDNEEKVHLNYLVKEGDEYRLSIFEDSLATSWNLNVFYNYAPKAAVPLRQVVVEKEDGGNDSLLLHAKLPKDCSFVGVFTGKPGEAALLLLKDNDGFDRNPAKHNVSFYLPQLLLRAAGATTVYVAAFNHPVNRSSPAFLSKEAAYTILANESVQAY